MIVIFGLLVLLAAAGVAVAGVAANSGSAHPLGDAFVIFGQSMTGLSTGQLFLYGIVVGVAGMLGLAMLLGAFNRRLASRGSRRELTGSRRESAALRLDRDRLTQELDDERSENLHADAATTPSAVGSVGSVDAADAADAAETERARQQGAGTTRNDRSTAREGAHAQRSGIWHRIGNRADR